MIARYGALWTNSHGTAPTGFDQAEWREAIADLTEDEIRSGFRADLDRGSDFPPSSAKLRVMCRPPQPVSDAPRTYLGTRPVKRELTALESERAREVADRELRSMCDRFGIDPASLTGAPA